MDETCPRCKSTKYRNPSMKLMVNSCGHAICQSCVELLFAKGTGSCPECRIPLRRGNYRLQLYEDASVEKEVDIRRKIMRDYNKREEDFGSLREWNDYLEHIETIIFNLANNVDVEETKKKVEQYRKDNKDSIVKNKLRPIGSEDQELLELLEEEKLLVTHRLEEHKAEAEATFEEKKRKLLEREALVDELSFSDEVANDILLSHELRQPVESVKPEKLTLRAKPVAQFSSGGSGFLPIPEQGPENLYTYEAPKWDTCGPSVRDYDEKKYSEHVRPPKTSFLAGGYVPQFGCLRALSDAFSGLYTSPSDHR
ncbi:unnamed protein product [Cyprideis torosa]|uniref:CDK-activating kinase assembly factor MAT1 n=1 Tax=Cyprideis torosa TaxID=163714 RepID=A0A7R8ZL42_9CRUS|nr:unnamed protein product [Cyprideis torosa]CAG0881542.1 unnamed protein product [Cyprideis torosa]